MFRVPTKEEKCNIHFTVASSVYAVSFDSLSLFILNFSQVTSEMSLALHSVWGKSHHCFYLLLLCPDKSWFSSAFGFKGYFQRKEVSWLWRITFYLLFSNTALWQLPFRLFNRKCIPELLPEVSNPGLQRKKRRRRCFFGIAWNTLGTCRLRLYAISLMTLTLKTMEGMRWDWGAGSWVLEILAHVNNPWICS